MAEMLAVGKSGCGIMECYKADNSHRIHVWYIYLHLGDFYGKCR